MIRNLKITAIALLAVLLGGFALTTQAGAATAPIPLPTFKYTPAPTPTTTATVTAFVNGQFIVSAYGTTIGQVYATSTDRTKAKVQLLVRGEPSGQAFYSLKAPVTFTGTPPKFHYVKGTSTKAYPITCTGTCLTGNGWK